MRNKLEKFFDGNIQYISWFIVCGTLAAFLYVNPPVEYLVRVTFCDNREPILVKYTDVSEPRSSHIENYKKAVPEWHGLLNVCEIEVVKIIDND